jgi:hypothetical protein
MGGWVVERLYWLLVIVSRDTDNTYSVQDTPMIESGMAPMSLVLRLRNPNKTETSVASMLIQ